MQKLSQRFMYYSGILAAHGREVKVDDLTHISNLIDAEENGSLLRLPCKIGDRVFALVNFCNDCHKYSDYCHRGCTEPSFRLIDFIVDHFEIHNNSLRVSAVSHYNGEGEWGKNVFSTKEEAEAALQKMREETQWQD